MMSRAAVILISGGALALLTIVPTTAAEEGTVVFRVEVRGDVPNDAWFLVSRDTDPPTIIEPGIFVCGPPENPYTEGGPVCAGGNAYETSITRAVGTELGYAFRLGYGWPDVGEEGTPSAVLHEGDITVQASTQTVTLVHDFSGGSLLPDTAVAPERALHPGWAALILGVMALTAATRSTGRRLG